MVKISKESLAQCLHGFKFVYMGIAAELVDHPDSSIKRVMIYTSEDKLVYYHVDVDTMNDDISVDKERFEEHITNQILAIIPGVFLIRKDSGVTVEYRITDNGEWWDECVPVNLDPRPWEEEYVKTVMWSSDESS